MEKKTIGLIKIKGERNFNLSIIHIVLLECYRAQQKSRDLDIMTGFQVMDGDKHVFVLEGLRDRAIAYVWETVPAPENSGKADWFYLQVTHI